MTNTQYTPGPLKAVQIIIENSPCTWAVQRKSIREQWGKPSIATYIDNEADARLFAAAPAMYEALVETMKVLRSLRDNKEEWYTLVTPELLTAWDKNKAALAQAEGTNR